MYRTSETHPLRIDSFPLWQGELGLTLCPGKYQPTGSSGAWARDLDADLFAIGQWRAFSVVSLLRQDELDWLRLPDFGDRVRAEVPTWMHLPIEDQRAPGADFLRQWRYARVVLASQLMHGSKVVLHCMGGLGRSGTVAAMLCIDSGMNAEQAIRTVRAVRPRAIETREQERFLEQYEPEWLLTPETVRVALTIWAGAAGDALGYPVEFDPLERIRERIGRQGIHPGRFPGQPRISDDTQMTLYALAAFADHGDAISVRELRKAWLNWYEGQAGLPSTATTPALARLAGDRTVNASRGPGGTCMTALGNGALGTLEEPLNDSKGCGALMRTAPIALASSIGEELKIGLAMSAAALTHGHRVAATTAALWTVLLGRRVFVLNQPAPDARDVIRDFPCLAEGLGDLLETVAFVDRRRAIPDELGEGWIAEEALAIALACADADPLASMSDVLASAANHSGDSDSTAALAGQMAATAHYVDSDLCEFTFRLDAYDAIADTLQGFLQTGA